MIGLTKRQSQCFRFVQRYIAEHSTGPTLREISADIGCPLSHAHYLLNQLEERGYIRRLPARPRAIEIITHHSVGLSDEVYRLTEAYARKHSIKLDTAANELLRQALGAA